MLIFSKDTGVLYHCYDNSFYFLCSNRVYSTGLRLRQCCSDFAFAYCTYTMVKVIIVYLLGLKTQNNFKLGQFKSKYNILMLQSPCMFKREEEVIPIEILTL